MLRLRILKPLLLLGFFLWNLSLGAQVGINDDGTAPAPSAVLDIKSTDKGLLIPRMTSMQRSDISAPATGLLVFDLDTESFWYHQTGGWVELSLQTPTGMIDGDQDTKIELVEGINDEIVFTLDGLPHLRLIDGRLETINLFRSVFLGGGAGRLDPVNSDLRNVMLGDSTMQRNQTGRFNTAIGYKSLEDNTSGRENVANGFVALPNNTTGERNIGIGDFANYNNKTGSDNICIGRDAGVNFDSLSNAIAIGWNAKAIQNNSMVLGSANDVGIGTNAPEAKLHVVGSMRIADGTQNSGYVFTSDANGLGSWQPNSADNFGNHTATQDLQMLNYSGTRLNKLVGASGTGNRLALNVISDGLGTVNQTNVYQMEILNNQTFGALTNTGSKMVETGITNVNTESDLGWIWRRSDQADDEGLMSLSGDGNLQVEGITWLQSNVGVGTTAPPTEALDVNGNVDVDLDLILNQNFDAPNSNANISFLTDDNVARMRIHPNGPVSIGSGSNQLRFYVYESVTTTDGSVDNYPMFISNTANPTGQNDRANGMVILAGRNSVGLNSTESSFLQFVRPDGSSGLFTVGKIKQNGDLTIAYNTASDMRLKTNIKPSTKGLNDLLKIQVADYNYIDDRSSDRRQGFLAQQLYQHFPYAVDEGGADPKDEPWMIDYGLLTPLLVQAIQDRQAIIDAHQAKIEQQQTRIETLQSEMQELDALKEKLAKLQTAIQSSPSPSTSK